MGAHFTLTRKHRAAIADQIKTLIALLDAVDAPFADLEQDDEPEDDDNDRCIAGEDMMRAGPTFHMIAWRPPTLNDAGHEPGCEDDAEDWRPPAFRMDQTLPLLLSAAND